MPIRQTRASLSMTTKTAPIHNGTVLTLLLFLSHVIQAEKLMAMTPTSIEIFTTIDQPISAIDTFVATHPEIDVRIHKLDAIKQLEGKLSQGLSADPDKAKRLVLRKLQQLSKATRSQLEHSARSLAKAVQYGVEKYPAIVFDGELVVYGLSDLSAALRHYRHWQAGEAL